MIKPLTSCTSLTCFSLFSKECKIFNGIVVQSNAPDLRIVVLNLRMNAKQRSTSQEKVPFKLTDLWSERPECLQRPSSVFCVSFSCWFPSRNASELMSAAGGVELLREHDPCLIQPAIWNTIRDSAAILAVELRSLAALLPVKSKAHWTPTII